MEYVFILGRNTKLSIAEILAVLPEAKVVKKTSSFLILDTKEFDPADTLKQLGGTIKIGSILSPGIDKEIIIDDLKTLKSDGKLKFGLSYYGSKQDKLGMEIKSELRKLSISCRLVTGKDKALSSVIVTKNNVNDYLILADDSIKGQSDKWLGKTLVVQDFQGYGFRDFGRPDRDMVSGSLPPKLAQIMINLSQTNKAGVLLDPFCGSGTVLQEALLLGFRSIIGTDKSAKAILDSKRNLDWLGSKFKLPIDNISVMELDVRDLIRKVKAVNAIVTEPYLGPPLKREPQKLEILKIIKELEDLYVGAFEQFSKILLKESKVVIVFPTFKIDQEVFNLQILDRIEKLGFTQVNKESLVYGRPGQYLYRDIKIFKHSS